jgi:hypothetical protein
VLRRPIETTAFIRQVESIPVGTFCPELQKLDGMICFKQVRRPTESQLELRGRPASIRSQEDGLVCALVVDENASSGSTAHDLIISRAVFKESALPIQDNEPPGLIRKMSRRFKLARSAPRIQRCAPALRYPARSHLAYPAHRLKRVLSRVDGCHDLEFEDSAARK